MNSWRDSIKDFIQHKKSLHNKKPLYEYDYFNPADRKQFMSNPQFGKRWRNKQKARKLMRKNLYIIIDGEVIKC